MTEVKQKIIELLKSTNRNGIPALIKGMEHNKFFDSPASTKYHGAYERGLADHSLEVFKEFDNFNEKYNLGLGKDTIIICSLLHDFCKAGAYIKNGDGYLYNKDHPKGHAVFSIKIIKALIELSEQEEKIIRYHMGMYGTNEFSNYLNEYSLKELVEVYNKNPVCKLFYFADEISTIKEKLNDKSKN